MKFAVVIFLMAFLIGGCKKRHAPSPITTQIEDSVGLSDHTRSRDYMFIPMKNVRWRIHCQGSYTEVQGVYMFDTSIHFYGVVYPVPGDTFMNGHKYYKFEASCFHTSNSDTVVKPPILSKILIHEDTLGKKVHAKFTHGNVSYDEKMLINYQPVGYSSIDSIMIDSVWNIKWNYIPFGGQECLMQAYGIGTQLGIMDNNFPITGNGAKFKSLDFIYKSDSIHFDF